MAHIVVPENFIRATRDTGYRGLAFALAELVDNAIDAEATEIDIRFSEERQSGQREITVSVLDNGRGMDKATLRESLRFGGTDRFNARRSLGRFGMGLPNSSVSQASRVDVYTWRSGRRPLRAYLDVDEIAGKRAPGVAEPVPTELPPWLTEKPPSGTLVEWSRCDRLPYKKASTLACKVRPVLGRLYRVPLAEGLLIRLNGEPLRPIDPLFRTPIDGIPGTCRPYGGPMEYSIKTSDGGVSVVAVQFVELPVLEWHDLPADTKRRTGIVGGAGISVLRGGREVDYGWHLFGSKRRENYDDWWRAELRFDPALDELIGITHSKQGINPSRTFRAILEPDLERVARDLNARVRKAFTRVRVPPPSVAVKRASDRDRLLPNVRGGVGPSIRRPAGEGFQFRIGFHKKATPEFFEARVKGSMLQLMINQNHPFYQNLYAHLSCVSDSLDVVLLAAARALLDLSAEARQTLLRSWSDNLLAYLAR